MRNPHEKVTPETSGDENENSGTTSGSEVDRSSESLSSESEEESSSGDSESSDSLWEAFDDGDKKQTQEASEASALIEFQRALDYIVKGKNTAAVKILKQLLDNPLVKGFTTTVFDWEVEVDERLSKMARLFVGIHKNLAKLEEGNSTHHFLQILSVAPKNAEIWLNLGVESIASGDVDFSKFAFQHAEGPNATDALLSALYLSRNYHACLRLAHKCLSMGVCQEKALFLKERIRSINDHYSEFCDNIFAENRRYDQVETLDEIVSKEMGRRLSIVEQRLNSIPIKEEVASPSPIDITFDAEQRRCYSALDVGTAFCDLFDRIEAYSNLALQEITFSRWDDRRDLVDATSVLDEVLAVVETVDFILRKVSSNSAKIRERCDNSSSAAHLGTNDSFLRRSMRYAMEIPFEEDDSPYQSDNATPSQYNGFAPFVKLAESLGFYPKNVVPLKSELVTKPMRTPSPPEMPRKYFDADVLLFLLMTTLRGRSWTMYQLLELFLCLIADISPAFGAIPPCLQEVISIITRDVDFNTLEGDDLFEMINYLLEAYYKVKKYNEAMDFLSRVFLYFISLKSLNRSQISSLLRGIRAVDWSEVTKENYEKVGYFLCQLTDIDDFASDWLVWKELFRIVQNNGGDASENYILSLDPMKQYECMPSLALDVLVKAHEKLGKAKKCGDNEMDDDLLYLEWPWHVIPFRVSILVDSTVGVVFFQLANTLYQIATRLSRYFLTVPSDDWRLRYSTSVLRNLRQESQSLFEEALSQAFHWDTGGICEYQWLCYFFLAKLQTKLGEDEVVRAVDGFYEAACSCELSEFFYPIKISVKKQQNIEPVEVHYQIHATVWKYIRKNEAVPLMTLVSLLAYLRAMQQHKVVRSNLSLFSAHPEIHEALIYMTIDCNPSVEEGVAACMDDILTRVDLVEEIWNLCHRGFELTCERFPHMKSYYRLAEMELSQGHIEIAYVHLLKHVFRRRKRDDSLFDSIVGMTSQDIDRSGSLPYHVERALQLTMCLAYKLKDISTIINIIRTLVGNIERRSEEFILKERHGALLTHAVSRLHILAMEASSPKHLRSDMYRAWQAVSKISGNIAPPALYYIQDEVKILEYQPKPHAKLGNLRGQWMAGNEIDLRSAGIRTEDVKTSHIYHLYHL
uniref:TPR_REGION domain-containing protein n=1 Tax=Angiostrongylus cantonensis TaxID=6313 RepID=A0A0K0DFA8_ANGCA